MLWSVYVLRFNITSIMNRGPAKAQAPGFKMGWVGGWRWLDLNSFCFGEGGTYGLAVKASSSRLRDFVA